MKSIYRSTLVLLALLALTIGAYAQDTAEAVECEAGTQPITHVGGVACVPENVERVVVLEWTYAENLLALGLQPVGVADIANYNNWVRIPLALDESVTDVGTRQEPNLETIIGLNPDLIIAVAFRVAESYDDLSAIAPTLVFNPYPADFAISQFDEMENTFRTIAQAVNRVEEGEKVLADMADYFAQAQAALEDAGHGGELFILAQGWTTDSVATFRLFTDNAMATQILARLGLENAWDDAPQLYGFTEIGIEGFAELLDREFNFFYVAQQGDNEAFSSSPLWGSLPFIQAGRAYWMGGDVWLFGGPLSAQLVVDTVLTALDVELPEIAAEETPAAEETSTPEVTATPES